MPQGDSAFSLVLGMGGVKRRLGVPARAVGLAVCLCALVVTGAQAVPTSPGRKGHANDCTTEAKLSNEGPTTIRYIVWCGAQRGRVTLRIGRPHRPGLTGFSPTAAATGPGAAGPLSCRPHRKGRVFCSGRARGPVTFRGTVEVAPGTRCTAKVKLNVWKWTGDWMDFPAGCPRAFKQRQRHLNQVIHERAQYGLDRDLAGDRGAIVSRAKGLLRAWRRGNPVARWTSEEETFQMPLTAAEQVELENREASLDRFQDLIEKGSWLEKNAPDSFAGYEIDDADGGVIYVGFTKEPEATLDKLKRLLIAPDRFEPFPIPPKYTEAELMKLLDAGSIWTGTRRNLFNSGMIDTLANKVRIGTEHVARVRRLLADKYGPEAPFEVVFEKPAFFF
jgi:hypothetical protein